MIDEIWVPLLGENNCATYDAAVDLDVLNVTEKLYLASKNNDAIYYTDVSEILQLNKTHVELILFMLCGAGFAEYGMSPRGCWLTKKGIEWYKKLSTHHEELKDSKRLLNKE